MMNLMMMTLMKRKRKKSHLALHGEGEGVHPVRILHHPAGHRVDQETTVTVTVTTALLAVSG
jgi:hypothetical protein